MRSPTPRSSRRRSLRGRRKPPAAEEWLEALDEDDLGQEVPFDDDSVSVRDVLVHVIEEYARHAGHADLPRECIDGRTGH